MVLNEKIKPFLVLILRFLTKKRLWFLNFAGSYKKTGVSFYKRSMIEFFNHRLQRFAKGHHVWVHKKI